MTRIALLQLGNTGDSRLKKTISSHLKAAKLAGYEIKIINHGAKFSSVMKDDDVQVAFFVRDPVLKFLTDYQKRLRQGRPGREIPWSAAERSSFEFFPTPEDLAISLNSSDMARRAAARLAILLIRDVKTHLAKPFKSLGALKKKKDRIYFLGNEADFELGIEQLLGKIGIEGAEVAIKGKESADDDVSDAATLSSDAVANLREWYAEDCKIYDWCLRHMKKLEGGSPEVGDSINALPRNRRRSDQQPLQP